MSARFSGWPITRLLPALLIGLVFVAIAPAVGIAYYIAQRNLETSSFQQNEQMVNLIDRRLQAQLEPVRSQLAYLADSIARGEVDLDNRQQWRAFALGSLAAVPQTLGFVFLPVDGEATRFLRNVRTMQPERREDIPLANSLLARARTMDGPGWGAPVWSNALGETILPIVAPVRVRGEFRGVIGTAIGTTDLSRFLKELELAGERKPFILFDRDKVLAHPWLGKEQGIAEQRMRGRPPTLAEVNDPVLAAMWMPNSNELVWVDQGTSITGHWNWVGESSHGWIYRPVSDYAPAELVVGYHVSGRASALERWLVRGILIVGALIMLFTALAAVLLSRRLARPVQALADAAGSVERLEFDKVPDLGDAGVREINQANRAFERMARGLKLSATYLPRTLVARLTAQQGALPVSEDRAVTVMFCDLEGYTAFSRGRPAVEAAAYLNALLDRVGPAIEASGGTIDKYMGDGLMAFWGAPEPRPDHAQLACLGALAVADEVELYNAERRARGEHACRMRIGLHAGTVLVGNIGFAGRVDYTAIGEAVNVASRLEQFARRAPRRGDATIVVSAACRAAAGDGFRCEPLDGWPRDVAAEGVAPLWELRGRAGASPLLPPVFSASIQNE
jgi:adenylate cyclase